MLQSIVSKAFERSRKIASGNSPLYRSSLILSIDSSAAISVECFFRKPYWLL